MSKDKVEKLLGVFELYSLIKVENIRKRFSEDFLLKVVNGDKKSIKKLAQFILEQRISYIAGNDCITKYWSVVCSYVDLVNKEGLELFLEILLKDFYLASCFDLKFNEPPFSFLHKIDLEGLEDELVDITGFSTNTLAEIILVNEERMTLNEMSYWSERDECFFFLDEYQEEYDNIVIGIEESLDKYKKIINKK